MIREEAVQYRRLETYVIRHCRSWHSFARSLDIHIGFGDLMLITECSKTAAWSSAVYSNSSTEFGLSFSIGMPFTAAGIAGSSSLEKIGSVERRRSQHRAHSQGPLPKNHAVFIKAYRLGTREAYRQSAVSIFMKALGFGTARNDARTNEVGPTALKASSSSSTGLVVTRPYEPVCTTLTPRHRRS